MPGESFGAGGAGHVRVALTVGEDQITEACRRMRELADSL
jgi:arginine:pyruvate transaminase